MNETTTLRHRGTVRLESDRLILRRFYHLDAEAMYENWAHDQRVTSFLSWPPHENLASTRELLRDWIGQYRENDCYNWAICLKEDDVPIGNIAVVDARPSVGMVHIGYCVAFDQQNKGLMSEAFARVIAFLFDEVGVLRIESRHDPANIASERVMDKCGLVKEGVLRRADRNNNGIVDACYHSLLAEEYARKKK